MSLGTGDCRKGGTGEINLCKKEGELTPYTKISRGSAATDDVSLGVPPVIKVLGPSFVEA